MENEKTQLDINKYLLPILKRKWLVIIPTLILSIGSVFYALRLPDVYYSQCVLVVTSSKIIDAVLKESNTARDQRNILQAVREKMLSWESINKVIKTIGIENIDGLEENDPRPKESAYRQILKNVALRTHGHDHIVISYEGKNPVTNFKIVDGLVSNFMEQSRKLSRSDAEETLSFIEGDLERLKSNLKDSEKRFRSFEEEHLEELPGNENSILPKLYASKEELLDVNRQIAVLEEKLKYLQEQKSTEKETITGEIVQIPNPKLNELDQQITDLEIEITMLQAKYFDNHPAIKKRKDELTRLREMLDKESEKVISEEKIINNPRYDSMIEREFAIMLELKSLRSQKSDIENEITKYKPMIENIPQLKQKLFELQSEFAMNKTLYEERLLQKSKAELVKKLTVGAKNDPFQIVEPARISYTPVKDEKIKSIAAGVILGLGMGIGLVFGLEKIDQKFKNVEDAEEYLNLPVLGAVPTIITKVKVSEG